MQLQTKEFRSNIEGQCHECGSNKLLVKGQLLFLKLLFIPILPISKKHYLSCSNCGKTIRLSNTEHNLIPKLDFFKKFIGAFLVVLLICLYTYNQKRLTAIENYILNNPQTFDFYIIDQQKISFEASHTYRFLIAKVTEVNKHNIRFKLSNYSYQNERGLIKDIRTDKLLMNNYFLTSTHALPKSQLLKLKSNGAIKQALRPRNLSLFGGLVVTPSEMNKL